MLIFWRIRYLDRSERSFKNRDLTLDTSTLSPAKRAAVELLAGASQQDRCCLKFRSLFAEDSWNKSEEQLRSAGHVNSFCLHDYFEDENGDEISLAEIGPILTGNPNTVLVPAGLQQHDIDYMFSEPKKVPIAEIKLSDEEARLFGYFVRDFVELADSALMREGAGSISAGGTLPLLPNSDFHHKTAVTDDEIRSFMTIFR